MIDQIMEEIVTHTKRLVSLLVFLVLAIPAFAQTSTTICAITDDPSLFDGQLVRIRALWVEGFEVNGIRDPDVNCFDVIGLDGQPEFGAIKNSNGGMAATMIGRIRYAGTGYGFGHRNQYRISLELQSVSDPYVVVGTITGQVSGPDGRPVAGAEVTAENRDSIGPLYDETPSCTDEKGKFTLAVPPGNYEVAVNPDSATSSAPFPTTQVPGRLLIRDKERKELSVTLANPYTLQKIPVKVVWPNGSPAPGVEVAIGDGSDLEAVDTWPDLFRTNQSGVVDLIGFHERDQTVFAHVWKRNNAYCAEFQIPSSSRPKERTVLRLKESRWCKRQQIFLSNLFPPCSVKHNP